MPTNYKEGAGEGVRYSAFDRYTKLAAAVARADAALANGIGRFCRKQQPLEFDAATTGSLPAGLCERPLERCGTDPALGTTSRSRRCPLYSDFVDRTVSGQEDLLVAFQELFTAPTPRHVFALMLAAFIDLVVFLLAFATGPYFFGAAGTSLGLRRSRAGRTGPSNLHARFSSQTGSRSARNGARGSVRAGARRTATLSALAAKKLAVVVEEDGRQYYMLDQSIHEHLLESLASQQFPLRAASVAAILAAALASLARSFGLDKRKLQFVFHGIHAIQQHVHCVADAEFAPRPLPTILRVFS